MLKWFLVAAGGGLGAVLRFGLQGLLQPRDSLFPVGTLLVNLVGCFAIGLLMTLFTGPLVIREDLRFGIIAGVLGGFTTFSAFSWETSKLLNDRQWGFALLYISLSVILGLMATFAGIRMSQWLFGP